MSRRSKRSAKPTEKFRSELTPDGVLQLLGGKRAVSLMRALGLVTAKGGASSDSHRKLKQLTHFLRLIEPGLRDVIARQPEPMIVDAAAGKGYLGLVIAELILRGAEKGRVVGIESRPELAERVAAVAAKMELPVDVKIGRIATVELPERAHFTLALHACDTATDEAIVRGIQMKSDYIAVVPCCQAEVARQLGELESNASSSQTAISPLWGNAWHRREFGAHLTNVIRALVLRANGYQVTVTELAGWEHSVKNELILARRVGRFSAPALEQLDALMSDIPVKPWLMATLPRPSLVAEPRVDAPGPVAMETAPDAMAEAAPADPVATPLGEGHDA